MWMTGPHRKEINCPGKPAHCLNDLDAGGFKTLNITRRCPRDEFRTSDGFVDELISAEPYHRQVQFNYYSSTTRVIVSLACFFARMMC